MNCLTATYEWQTPSAVPEGTSPSSSSSSSPLCRCSERSRAEQELQELKAKAELALLRDRVRKMFTNKLNEPQRRESTAAPIRIEWQVEPTDLVHRLCHWKHTSALTLIGMTPCLAELTRQHRKLEGTSPEPPASKNKLTLVVWNLAATIQGKLREWRGCVAAETEETFVGVIVVRTSELVPLWTWETDILRHRPALVEVCDRMLSMELWQYRQRCNQLTKREQKLARRGQIAPSLTPFGLRWPLLDGTSSSIKAARPLPGPALSSAVAPATTRIQSRLKMSELSMDSKPLNSSKRSESSKSVDPSVDPSKPLKPSTSSFSDLSSLSRFSKSAKHSHVRKPAASGDTPTTVFAGETFCVSGPFTVDQKAMLALISSHGGSIASTVTRLCTYLVADQLGSAKTRKAQANGVPIVTKAWIRTSIAEGKKSTDADLFATSSASCSINKHSASSKATCLTSPRDRDDIDDDDDDDDYDDEAGDLDLESGDESEQSGSNSDSDVDLDSASERRSKLDLDESSEEDGDNNRPEGRSPSKPTRTHVKPRPHRSSFE